VQIIGIIAPIVLIPEFGILPMMLSAGVVAGGALWYFLYARHRVERSAAMYQVFERMGMQATPELNEELREIIREKGARRDDIFEQCILRAAIIRHDGKENLSGLYHQVAAIFAERLEFSEKMVYDKLTNTTQIGDTPIGRHVALPHLKFSQVDHAELVIIHSKKGLNVEGAEEPVYAIFVLISPKNHPRQHLRFLAELANRAEQISFNKEWRSLKTEDELRNLFIRADDKMEVVEVLQSFEGKRIRELSINRNCIIAIIKREGEMIVPRGDTVIKEGDELTLVGDKSAVKQMKLYFNT